MPHQASQLYTMTFCHFVEQAFPFQRCFEMLKTWCSSQTNTINKIVIGFALLSIHLQKNEEKKIEKKVV